MKKLSSLVIRFRIPIIILTVLLTAFFGYFIKDIKINADILSYLPEDDPVTELNTYISEQYGGSQMAVIAVEAEDIFTTKTLGTIHYLTSAFQLIEGIQYVTSLTNLMDIRKVEDWLEVGLLIDPDILPETEEEMQDLKKYILGKEMYRDRIISIDGRVTIIICRLQEDADKPLVAREIRSTVGKAGIAEKVYFAGLPFQLTEINDVVQSDILKLIPLTILLITLSLYLSFRSVRGIILPLLSAGVSSIWAIGVMSLCSVSFSVISNIIPVVLIAVGSAYGIHVVNIYSEVVTANSRRKEQSKKALSKIALPVILAAVTTIAGFMAFIFSSYLSMIKDFGIFSSLGIFFALFLSLTFVPSVLSLLPVKDRKKKRNQTAQPEKAPLKLLGNFVIKHNKIITAVCGVLIVVSIAGMTQIKREVELLSYFKQNTEIRLSEHIMKKNFGGSTTLQILVQGNIHDPVVLERMKKMESFLSSRSELNNVHSVVELIEEMNFAMIDEKILPDTEAKVANLWFFLEGEEMLDQLVSEDRDEAVIQATIKEYNIRQLTELVHIIRSYIRGMDSEECSFQLGGSLLTYYQVNEALKKSQIQSLVIAILMIFLCNFIMLRSVAGSLIGLIPVGFTLFILYGFMGLSGIPLDVATVLIGSISLGVGIDYSIHFLNRFKHNYRVSRDKTTALAGTLRTTGKAILINVVTVTAGFLTLLLGSLIPLQRFGILISLTMLSSGSGALLLLPSIILLSPEKLFRGVMERMSLSGTGFNIKTRLQPARVRRDPGNIRKSKTKGVNK